METSPPITELVNAADRQTLAEDANDLAAFASRSTEPLISYDEMIKALRDKGQI